MGSLAVTVRRRDVARAEAARMASVAEPADDLVIESAPLGAFEAPTPVPVVGGPRRIGRYEIVGELGRGGMGVVYLCRRAGAAGFERLVAVKHLHAHLAADPELVAMLLDEARLAAKIRHHNVASVVEVGAFEHGHYLVMPYVEGCTLGQLLARSRSHRPARLIVPIMIDVLEGLHAAHPLRDGDTAAELVHRDVSPGNILVGTDGAAQISDFGVARARARFTSTLPGTIKGTLCFSAPEVFRGEPVDRRADVFAAGVVLWTALTGRGLFRGDTDAETIARVLSLEVPPPSQVGLMPPAALDRIVGKALARDPAERYATAAEMASDLRETAIEAGLLGAPSEVAAWVTEAFRAELTARERLVGDTEARRDPASVVVLPPLVAPHEVTPPALAPEGARPVTKLEIARFIAALVLAFVAGSLVTLSARGLL